MNGLSRMQLSSEAVSIQVGSCLRQGNAEVRLAEQRGHRRRRTVARGGLARGPSINEVRTEGGGG